MTREVPFGVPTESVRAVIMRSYSELHVLHYDFFELLRDLLRENRRSDRLAASLTFLSGSSRGFDFG
jgi:hypothetical protein